MKDNFLKALMLALFVILLTPNTYGQNKKLYFLADTLHSNKLNQLFDIGNEGKAIQYYQFYCKCIAPYQQNILFVYRPYKVKPTYTKKLPPYNFISWSALSELLSQKGRHFDSYFELYIVEALPNNIFMTNRVNLFIKKDQVTE